MDTIKYRQPIRSEDGSFFGWHFWGMINGRWIDPGNYMPETKNESQLCIGTFFREEVPIHDGDIIEFWMAYPTTQTHTGDNIPGGSYTEPDESQVVKVMGQVYYNKDVGAFRVSVIGKIPYNIHEAFGYAHLDYSRPIIGDCDGYSLEYLRELLCKEYIMPDEYLVILKGMGIDTEEDLERTVNSVSIIGNVHENPDLLA